MQVGEGALDDPADGAEAGAVVGAAASDQRPDPAGADESAVLVVVVAAVCDQLIGTSAWSANNAPDRRHAVEQRDQLRHVVAVAAGQRPGERDPGRVDQEVVLGAVSGSVNRARARFGAPFFACT